MDLGGRRLTARRRTVARAGDFRLLHTENEKTRRIPLGTRRVCMCLPRLPLIGGQKLRIQRYRHHVVHQSHFVEGA